MKGGMDDGWSRGRESCGIVEGPDAESFSGSRQPRHAMSGRYEMRFVVTWSDPYKCEPTAPTTYNKSAR